MPKRALAEHRPWLLASLAAAIAFYFLSDDAFPGLYLALVKGSAVGLLAVYAWVRHPEIDAKLLALVMALSACGDALLEFFFQIGAVFFFASHLAALSLYLRNKRANPVSSQKLAAVGLLIGTPVISWLLTRDWQVALYALALGGMACAAWLSRFSRYRVGLGAVLFVISDWLIFAEMGPLADSAIPDWLIWPLYYSGQFLIATGVIQTLRSELADN